MDGGSRVSLRPAAWTRGVALKLRILALAWIVATVSLVALANQPKTVNPPVIRDQAQADAMRLEGEKRFRANCGRCHAAPQKFPPRMMATIVRHMRVRATITDEDMRLVLFYMTQ